jgi:hypothetical protein
VTALPEFDPFDGFPPDLFDAPFDEEALARYIEAGPSDVEAVTSPQDYTDDAVERSTIHAWCIEDDGAAQWCAARLAKEQDALDRLRAQADDWSLRIAGWFEQASKGHQRTADYMESRLEMYGLAVRERGGDPTIHLPSATISTSSRKAAVEIVDEDAVAAWAYDIPDKALRAALGSEDDDSDALRATLVHYRPKVYVGPLRKLARVEDDRVVGLDGEPVPGTAVRPAFTAAKVQVIR